MNRSFGEAWTANYMHTLFNWTYEHN
jgi:hypothetical protein